MRICLPPPIFIGDGRDAGLISDRISHCARRNSPLQIDRSFVGAGLRNQICDGRHGLREWESTDERSTKFPTSVIPE